MRRTIGQPVAGRDVGASRAVAARRGTPAERGSATVWVASGCLFLMMVAAGATLLAAAVAARHRAASAADLSALAAASRWLEGTGGACARAAVVADMNRARLVGCALSGRTADVTVQLRMAGVLDGLPPVRARSRAGWTQ